MGRVSLRTIGYAALMVLILIAVAYLLIRVARTETANRRLITIFAVAGGAILVGGLGVLGLRGRRSGAVDEDDSNA